MGQALPATPLPVAAMPTYQGEVWAAYRAKTRPCLILSCDNPKVDGDLTRGMANHATAPTCIVAPYYGVAKSAKRVGYNAQFVEQVRRCAYPQFLWDVLPFSGGEESILRLDQMQAIGAHHNAFKHSGFSLSSAALDVLDELIEWLIWKGLPADSLIALYRSEVESILGS